MYIVIDDSRQTIPSTTSLMSFGSLWVPHDALLELEREILLLRLETNCWGEFKWNNIDENYLEVYKKLIDIFFRIDSVKFNSITQKVPTTGELKAHHGGSMRTAEMKAIFGLIFHNFIRYQNNFCIGKRLNLIADDPYLERGDYKEMFLKQFQSPTSVPINSATKVSSEILGTLQLSDIILGISLVNICQTFWSCYRVTDAPKKEVLAYLTRKTDINPKTFGRPEPAVKVNNWFHRPGIYSRLT